VAVRALHSTQILFDSNGISERFCWRSAAVSTYVAEGRPPLGELASTSMPPDWNRLVEVVREDQQADEHFAKLTLACRTADLAARPPAPPSAADSLFFRAAAASYESIQVDRSRHWNFGHTAGM
jgi:hypothetical protein